MTSSEEPWNIDVVPGSLGSWQQLTCVVTAAGIQAALSSSSSVASMRSLSGPPARSILLVSDVALIDEDLASMNVLLAHDPIRPQPITLEVLFNLERPRDQAFDVTLVWGEQHRQALLDAHGRAIFTDLTLDSPILDSASAGLRLVITPRN